MPVSTSVTAIQGACLDGPRLWTGNTGFLGRGARWVMYGVIGGRAVLDDLVVCDRALCGWGVRRV